MCKDIFSCLFLFFFSMEMFIDFHIRFQISLCPYVTIPSITSKDAVADLAVVIKLKPHYRLHMDCLVIFFFITVKMLHM